MLDVSNFADSRTGLCQQCLGHNVAELEAEKEVDTRDGHADAEENDEKRESFEDLPEHLRLGTEFTLRVTVLQVQPSLTTYFESDSLDSLAVIIMCQVKHQSCSFRCNFPRMPIQHIMLSQSCGAGTLRLLPRSINITKIFAIYLISILLII